MAILYKGALKYTQYQFAFVVSRAWKGTNREKIHEELGWETLYQRRMFRHLMQFVATSPSLWCPKKGKIF